MLVMAAVMTLLVLSVVVVVVVVVVTMVVGGEGVGVGASGIVPMCLFSTLMEAGTTGLAVGLVGVCGEFGVVAMLFL